MALRSNANNDAWTVNITANNFDFAVFKASIAYAFYFIDYIVATSIVRLEIMWKVYILWCTAAVWSSIECGGD